LLNKPGCGGSLANQCHRRVKLQLACRNCAVGRVGPQELPEPCLSLNWDFSTALGAADKAATCAGRRRGHSGDLSNVRDEGQGRSGHQGQTCIGGGRHGTGGYCATSTSCSGRWPRTRPRGGFWTALTKRSGPRSRGPSAGRELAWAQATARSAIVRNARADIGKEPMSRWSWTSVHDTCGARTGGCHRAHLARPPDRQRSPLDQRHWPLGLLLNVAPGVPRRSYRWKQGSGPPHSESNCLEPRGH
jgi:hypothetical protein